MAIVITETRVSSDRTEVCAISVGAEQWVLPNHLRGRTFTLTQVLGIVKFAEFIGDGRDPRPLDADPTWVEAAAWLGGVGLSIREAAQLLELPCNPFDLPWNPHEHQEPAVAVPARAPMRALLGGLIGRRS